ncbi:MAG: NAD-dependent epimerase [Epsilonproteobacteria bacterium]|nr:NAD-dependent epimerase [Campylobacterota bacterium]
MQSKKILVTGTAGFIGHNLAKKLLARGDEVVGLDNINDYYEQSLKFGRLKDTGIEEADIKYGQLVSSQTNSNYRFIKLNLEDREEMEKLFTEEKFTNVCHLAAQAGVRYSLENPHEYIQSNVVGFMNILECCRHHDIKALSYASSSSVYGMNKEQPFSTKHNVDHPISLYAASKKSNELMAHTYSHLFNLPTTGLRFFTVYGPWGRPDMAPFLFTRAILDDKPINVFNNGKMERDFTYIDDITEGIIRVIDHPTTGETPYKIYNIGNNAPVKLMDFIQTLEEKIGKNAAKNMMPMQPGDVYSTYADTTELINELGYKPTTSLKEGISEFIDWYQDFYQTED